MRGVSATSLARSSSLTQGAVLKGGTEGHFLSPGPDEAVSASGSAFSSLISVEEIYNASRKVKRKANHIEREICYILCFTVANLGVSGVDLTLSAFSVLLLPGLSIQSKQHGL